MRLFDNAEYTKNRNLYVKTPDDGALANLRESYKMLFGLSLRTIVPINTKYRLTHRPNLMMYLDKFKNKYPRIKDIVSCILDGYINNPQHYTLPYSGSDRRKNYVRLCHDCRKEDRELKVLTRNKFSDIRLARIIINMYLY